MRAGRRVTLDCPEGSSRTRQSQRDEADVNKILARYARTGVLTHVAPRMPAFLNVIDMPDYRGALEYMRQAEGIFKELSAKERAEFDNDVTKFLDFAVKPESEDRLRELGILPKKEAAEAPPAVPGAPAAPLPTQ